GAVSRRTRSEPRSGSDARDRANHRRNARRRHQDRDGYPQSRPSAPARRGNSVLPSGQDARARPSEPVFQAARVRGSRAVSGRRVAVVAVGRIFLGAVLALFVSTLQGQERFITVASTTSTEQSGLFDHLLPIFERQTGIKVHVVARSEEHTSELQSRFDLVCRLLLEKKKKQI